MKWGATTGALPSEVGTDLLTVFVERLTEAQARVDQAEADRLLTKAVHDAAMIEANRQKREESQNG